MADIDFPASLPCMLSGSLVENGVDPWIQDQGEVGAMRRRKRFTRSLKSFSFSMRLTNVEKAALIEFYDETLDDGVAIFNWRHPWTGDIYEVRFAARPSFSHRYNRIWATEVTLEEV